MGREYGEHVDGILPRIFERQYHTNVRDLHETVQTTSRLEQHQANFKQALELEKAEERRIAARVARATERATARIDAQKDIAATFKPIPEDVLIVKPKYDGFHQLFNAIYSKPMRLISPI